MFAEIISNNFPINLYISPVASEQKHSCGLLDDTSMVSVSSTLLRLSTAIENKMAAIANTIQFL